MEVLMPRSGFSLLSALVYLLDQDWGRGKNRKCLFYSLQTGMGLEEKLLGRAH